MSTFFRDFVKKITYERILLAALLVSAIMLGIGLSFPPRGKDWVDVLGAMLTPLIAVWAGVAGWRGLALERRKREDEIFERRHDLIRDWQSIDVGVIEKLRKSSRFNYIIDEMLLGRNVNVYELASEAIENFILHSESIIRENRQGRERDAAEEVKRELHFAEIEVVRELRLRTHLVFGEQASELIPHEWYDRASLVYKLNSAGFFAVLIKQARLVP